MGKDGYEHIKKHILVHRENGHEIDVFFHSWEPDLMQQICELYEPVRWMSQSQINFEEVAKTNSVSREDLDPTGQLGSWSLTSKTGNGYIGPERILSHFYSVQKALELCKRWEEENGFRYDCIIKSRFDLGRINRKHTGNNHRNKPVQCINFDPDLDMRFFYQANWDLFNEGPADMWFYSNSENMDAFCKLYDKTLTEYLQKGSDYSKSVVEGWVESKANDFRTNESFKNPADRATDLHKYPPHMVSNTILLYKWFLIDSGLWNKSRPLETQWE